jgi:hypothetical protein
MHRFRIAYGNNSICLYIINDEKERIFCENILLNKFPNNFRYKFMILARQKHCFPAKKKIKLGESELFCEKRTRTFND